MKNTYSSNRGFSLVEMLVVVGILGILIAILMSAVGGATESARAAKCVTNLKSLAQAANNYKMSTGLYPRAGSGECMNMLRYTEAPGWISWLSRDKYNSPRSIWDYGTAKSHQTVAYCPFYGTSEIQDNKWALEHGQLWSACGRNRDVFVCPTHAKKCQEWQLGNPLFSYVMNAKFIYDHTERQGSIGRNPASTGVGSMPRADRTLMFADIHMADDFKGGKLGSAESDPRVDQVLNYTATVNGKDYYSYVKADRPEQIGFTHKGSDGRYYSHVAFADGHVEKLVLPGKNSALDVEQLTALLCEGIDFAATGSNYTTITKADEMQGK